MFTGSDYCTGTLSSCPGYKISKRHEIFHDFMLNFHLKKIPFFFCSNGFTFEKSIITNLTTALKIQD